MWVHWIVRYLVILTVENYTCFGKYLVVSFLSPFPKYTTKVDQNDNNKENSDNIWSSHQTYPNKESHQTHSAHKIVSNQHPNSEVKKRSVLMPHNNNPRTQHNIINSTQKRTPEIKPPSSVLKLKSVTPKIKSGIRRFTPGSGRQSSKRTPANTVGQNRDKVRCELFAQSHKNGPAPQSKPSQLQASIPETPMNKKPLPLSYATTPSYPQGELGGNLKMETPLNQNPLPASYATTPSYPQGVLGGNLKYLFKTTSIKNKKYMFIKKLGAGGSSEVYKVLDMTTSCEYAVKCVNLSTNRELAQGYINEVRLLRELRDSDRVIRLYDYEYDRTNQLLRMVLEVGETDLSSFLNARGADGLPYAFVMHYWEEMLQAVHYIHEHGVIHADLKPANFLLVCGQLKLIDFGIASTVSEDATSVLRSQAAGTFSYISPEALMGGAGAYAPADGTAPIKISFRSDVWSLGCILYRMAFGRTPFSHIPSLAKLAAILDPNHKIDYPPVDHLPLSLLTVLKRCLTYNARARPTVRELLALQARPPLPQAVLDELQTSLPPHVYKLVLPRL